MPDINRYIESTGLKSTTTKNDVLELCQEALQYNFYGVCIPPYFVQQAKRFVKENKAKTKIITVIGFPLGYLSVASKVEEAKKAIQDGADELDVVVNLSAYLSGDLAVVKNDINSVVTACQLQNKIVKVILETGALTENQILELADIVAEANANFVKTSTGYYEKGVSLDAVKLLRKHLPEKIGIKASGSIKTREFALDLLDAGANRLGTSSAKNLLK